MITLRGVHKSFARQLLFDGADLQINAGDRFALVGPNGAGKSTLLKMLLGELEADSGELSIKRGVRVGYLAQENAPLSEGSVLAGALAGTEDADGRLTARAKAILMGLGFKGTDFERAIKELSGGWAMRVSMARLLVDDPDLLLLDEPTNHLDLDSTFWLRDYLLKRKGALLLVSHDRDFMDHVTRAMVSVQDHKLVVYPGAYGDFLAAREAEKEKLIKAYKQQQEEIAAMEDFVARNRVRHSTAARAQSMLKRLEKLERIEVPPENRVMKIRFPQPRRSGVRVLQLKGVDKSYGANKVYEGLDFELERGWRLAFVGHNGAGKSTLLRMLAGVLPFEKGERSLGHEVTTGYFSQHRAEQLAGDKTVFQEALSANRETGELAVRTILGTFLFSGDSIFKPVHVLSGGEKSRLALVKILLEAPNCLFLDEPTTHLDMASVEALAAALSEFEGTVCLISHDIYFVNRLATHVVHVDHGRVRYFPGNYEYFERRRAQMIADGEFSAEVLPPKADVPEAAAAPAGPSRVDVKRQAKEKERLEREILDLEIRLEELAGKLADPELYADFAKVQSLGDEMETVQNQLGEKTDRLKRLGGA
ncbi:MAG: ABC-F family ATP-binding cassette domain-containing protein [Elusimicrobia bacterium]|nr:ABC-F family ATP-binding cassette domain-containing protein [Elusimicrobiota bacterium]